jgi:hypothetical protein
MLDIIGESYSSLPWLYRGWAILFSKKYRRDSILQWKKTNIVNKIFDPLISLAFMVAEMVLIYYAYIHLAK